MLVEVPSIKANPKGALEVARSVLKTDKVFLFPITETLVFAYDHKPTEKELAFPVAVRKLLEQGIKGVYLYIDFEKDLLLAVAYDGNKIRKYSVSPKENALASILHSEKRAISSGIIGFLSSDETKAEELIKKAIEIAEAVPKNGTKKLSVQVKEEYFSYLITQRSLLEETKKLIAKLRENPQAKKVLVLALIVLALIPATYYGQKFYKNFKQKREKRTVVSAVRKKHKTQIPQYRYNLGVLSFLSGSSSFIYDGKNKTVEILTTVPKKGEDLKFKLSNYYLYKEKVKPVKDGSSCSLEGIFWEIGNREEFFFKGTLEDLKEKVLCLNKPVFVSGIKQSDGSYYFSVSLKRKETEVKTKRAILRR